MTDRYPVNALRTFAARLFETAGLETSKAEVTAELLVEADMMGHTTHGLALAPAYLAAISSGQMTATGEPLVMMEAPAAATWDGQYLPGLWLTALALDDAARRATVCGTGTVVVRRSHHIGCLAAFLPRATGRGLLAIIASSDPSVATVAPFGGRQAVLTPNPIAIGIPTSGDPMLIDISASITTNAMSARLAQGGATVGNAWYLDAAGTPSHDPAVVTADPPGTILPLGGLDHGHKGYGLGIAIEALTQALSGFGRSQTPGQWGASVFVQVQDPRMFGGSVAFARETDWLSETCRANPPRPGIEAVRVPGDAAMRRRGEAIAHGVPLFAGIFPALREEAVRLGVAIPPELAD